MRTYIIHTWTYPDPCIAGHPVLPIWGPGALRMVADSLPTMAEMSMATGGVCDTKSERQRATRTDLDLDRVSAAVSCGGLQQPPEEGWVHGPDIIHTPQTSTNRSIYFEKKRKEEKRKTSVV
jgi:hypothetical protein